MLLLQNVFKLYWEVLYNVDLLRTKVTMFHLVFIMNLRNVFCRLCKISVHAMKK